MIQIPKRISLISETAWILRDGINKGFWKETLPGERELSDQLQVSRPTLRAALSLLQKDGMIRAVHGKRRLIFPVEEPPHLPQRRKIGLITHAPISQVSQMTFQLMMEVRHHLHQGGFDSEVFFAPSQDFRKCRAKLENFIEKHSVCCCLLMLSSEEEQKWIYDRGIPALVLGSSYPSAELPSLDVDYYSVCRHAAGIFLGRGHRRLALIRSDNRIAGDRTSVEGFMDGIAQSPHAEAHCTVIRHRGMPTDLNRQLDLLLDSGEPRPTGIFTCRPLETLVVIMHLQKRGISIPEDISIIARDRDLFFDCLEPKIAHYAYSNDVICRRLTRLMLKLLGNGTIFTRGNLIHSELKDGESLRTLDPADD